MKRAPSSFPRQPAREQDTAPGSQAANLEPRSRGHPAGTAGPLGLPCGCVPVPSWKEGSVLESEIWLQEVTWSWDMGLQAQLRTKAKARPSEMGMSVAVCLQVPSGSEYGGWGGTFYGGTCRTSPEAPTLLPSSIWLSHISP